MHGRHGTILLFKCSIFTAGKEKCCYIRKYYISLDYSGKLYKQYTLMLGGCCGNGQIYDNSSCGWSRPHPHRPASQCNMCYHHQSNSHRCVLIVYRLVALI